MSGAAPAGVSSAPITYRELADRDVGVLKGVGERKRASLAAVDVHNVLDLLTTYSVQLWSPFSGAWFHSDGLFIIDVWVWLLLGGIIAWSKTREKRGAEWRRPVQAAIGITSAYIGLNLTVSQNAYAAASKATRGRPVDAMVASPPPLVFWHRDLVWREQDCYRRASFTPLDGLGRISRCEPTNMNNPIVREAVRGDPVLQNFLRWSILPQADVQRFDCSVRVTIGDARYGQGRNSRLSRETVLPISKTGC